jgi:hypothetical protein
LGRKGQTADKIFFGPPFYVAALHVRFRRLTLRFRLRSEATARQAATGTAQRAIPTAGRVAAAWPFYVEISHFTYVDGEKPNAAGSRAEFMTRLMRFGKPCSLGRRDLE